MTIGKNSAKRGGRLVFSLVLTAAVAAGEAQAASDEQIQQLENALQQLRQQHEAELQRLEQEIALLRARVAASQPAAPQLGEQPTHQFAAESGAPPKLVESPTHQFGLASEDGQNSIALLARLNFDGGDYLKVSPDGGAKGAGPGSPGHPLDSGVDARRARLGIGGTFMGDWAYRLIYDFGNSADSVTTGVSGAVTSGVENAYITYNGFNKAANPVPVAADLGYLDIPWTLDEATSSNDIMFLERSSSQVIATQFGGGDFRSGLGLRSNNKRYWAGVYVTGPQSGAPHTGANGENFSSLARASAQLLQTDSASLHLGVNVGRLFNSRLNSSSIGASSISTTGSNSALSLSDRPELRIDPTVILNTGSIPAHAGTVLGTEGAASYGGLFLQGEYFHYSLDQSPHGVNPGDGAVDLASPTLNFQGGYVEGSYSLGGRRRYIPETGAYSGVVPEHPFSLSGAGWGALELAARFSTVDLNDKVSPGRAPHLTGGIDGGDQIGYDLGLNWYPNANMRFMLDFIHTDVDKLFKSTTNGTAPNTPVGAHIDALAARSQLAF